MNKYIKVFFKYLSWSNDKGSGSCYVYTSTPGYSCTVDNGSDTATFGITIRSKKTSDTSFDESVTMWLSDRESGKSISADEAKLWKQVYGSVAYLRLDENNSFKLINGSDFGQLPADERAQLVASLQLA